MLVDGMANLEDELKSTINIYDEKFDETESKFDQIEIDFDYMKVCLKQEKEIREYKINELKEEIIKNELANNLNMYKSIISLRIICNIFMVYLLIDIPRTWPISVPILIWSMVMMWKETQKYTLLMRENESL
jgi:hypothetical protein